MAEVTTRQCRCGCGEATSSSRAMYKPGHDARHAGKLGRALGAAIASGDKEEVSRQNERLQKELPSEALQTKAAGMAQREADRLRQRQARDQAREKRDQEKAEVAKQDRKALQSTVAAEEADHAEAEAAKNAARSEGMPEFNEDDGWEEVEVKIGRWTYPGRRREVPIAGGDPRIEVKRNTQRDGSGDWIPADPDLVDAS